MTAARYAIYHAPAPASLLWQRASAWLGRDAASGETLLQPRLAGLADLDFPGLTADPRHYGFHATLKAPFALAKGTTEADLHAAAADFVRARPAFAAAIRPAALGAFLAFRIEAACPAMAVLESDCVRHFEPFRAPLDDADLARRRRAALTPRQDAQLREWGYPYVFDDFRFHMTLTGAIGDPAIRTRVLEAAQDYFAAVPPDHRFDAICVFRQSDRTRPFTVTERFGFGGSALP